MEPPGPVNSELTNPVVALLTTVSEHQDGHRRSPRIIYAEPRDPSSVTGETESLRQNGESQNRRISFRIGASHIPEKTERGTAGFQEFLEHASPNMTRFVLSGEESSIPAYLPDHANATRPRSERLATAQEGDSENRRFLPCGNRNRGGYFPHSHQPSRKAVQVPAVVFSLHCEKPVVVKAPGNPHYRPEGGAAKSGTEVKERRSEAVNFRGMADAKGPFHPMIEIGMDVGGSGTMLLLTFLDSPPAPIDGHNPQRTDPKTLEDADITSSLRSEDQDLPFIRNELFRPCPEFGSG